MLTPEKEEISLHFVGENLEPRTNKITDII